MKKIVVVAVIVIIALFSVACDKEVPLDGNIDTPVEAFYYFYQSLAGALQAENAEVKMTVLLDGEVETETFSFIKKSGGVVLFDRDGENMAYYDGKAYFGDDYALNAVMTLSQFLALVFNNVYEVDIEYFLFPTSLEFAEQTGGHKLTAEASGFPHTYSMELLTDESDSFLSAKITSEVIWFTREIDIEVTNSVPENVPAAAVFATSLTDRTETYNNLFEMSSYVYAYTQGEDMKKDIYKAENTEIYPGVPNETMRVKGSRAYFGLTGYYSYYDSGKFYTCDESLLPAFHQKTYADMPISNVRYKLFQDIFYILREADDDIIVTKTVTDNTITYASNVFDFVIKDGALDYITIKDYASWEEKWYFTKHKFSLEVEDISPPSGFSQSEYISFLKDTELSYAATALEQSNEVMYERYIYNGTNPEPYHYAQEIDSLNIAVVTTQPEILEISPFTYYIHEVPTTGEGQGSVIAIYYKGSTETFKVYYNESEEIVYDVIG
jgi:hypothetical protein